MTPKLIYKLDKRSVVPYLWAYEVVRETDHTWVVKDGKEERRLKRCNAIFEDAQDAINALLAYVASVNGVLVRAVERAYETAGIEQPKPEKSRQYRSIDDAD